MELEIVYLDPHELTPYENNTRKHSPEDIDQIKASIEADGFNDPIGVWGDNNLIVEGHGRQIAAIEMGIDRVPCIRLDHLTDAQRRDYAIRHNFTSDQSEFDFGRLREEVAALELQGMDMSYLDGIGEELDALGTESIDDYDIKEDEPPEPPETPVAKQGDIWQLGVHRIMCGDSTNPDNVNKLLCGAMIDTYFVDPPYEQESLYDVIPENNGDRLFVFSDHKHFQKAICAATEKKWPARFELVWDCCQSWYTPNRPLARHKTCYLFGNDEKWRFDRAIIQDGKTRQEKDVKNTRGGCHYIPLDGAVHMRTIESFPNTAQNDENGYGKPVKWLAAMLEGYGGTNVLDYYAGSGAVLIACEQTGRKCFSIELSPHYCDVIIQRWENLTGEKAVLLNGAA